MQRTYSLSQALFFVLIFISSCGDDKPNSTQLNHAPIIIDILASPDELQCGVRYGYYYSDTTQLSCMASDEDGDSLQYTWDCSEGHFRNANVGRTVLWEPPDHLTGTQTKYYSIRVFVSDGRLMDTASAIIKVVLVYLSFLLFRQLSPLPTVSL